MLAYFFAFWYIMEIYISQKRQFCLGSITKCDVIRTGGGLQSRAKNKAPFEKLRLADFSIMGAMVLLGVSFSMCLGWSANSQDGLQGWMEYATPALQVVIVSHLLGNTREMATV